MIAAGNGNDKRCPCTADAKRRRRRRGSFFLQEFSQFSRSTAEVFRDSLIRPIQYHAFQKMHFHGNRCHCGCGRKTEMRQTPVLLRGFPWGSFSFRSSRKHRKVCLPTAGIWQKSAHRSIRLVHAAEIVTVKRGVRFTGLPEEPDQCAVSAAEIISFR